MCINHLWVDKLKGCLTFISKYVFNLILTYGYVLYILVVALAINKVWKTWKYRGKNLVKKTVNCQLFICSYAIV